MKYLHIAHDSIFIRNYINLIRKEFSEKEHTFIISIKNERENENYTKKNSNIVFWKRIRKDILKLVTLTYRSDRIVLHSIFDMNFVAYFFLNPWLIKKCNWIIWGGDLYQYEFKKNTLKENLDEYMRRFVIKRLGYISYLTYGDYDLAKEWYQTNAKPLQAVYNGGTIIDACKKFDGIDANQNKTQINIVVGNSADPANRHIQILETLYKYKDRGIQIFCPISYGDEIYANTIIEYGKERYGEQFHPLTEFLDFDEYCSFLNRAC
jgi:dTDP-N-acetylfucosamine:lipid II N-acetylfucosaminyltransferase